MVQQIKLLSAILTIHMYTSSSPGGSTSNSTPCYAPRKAECGPPSTWAP